MTNLQALKDLLEKVEDSLSTDQQGLGRVTTREAKAFHRGRALLAKELRFEIRALIAQEDG